jgi:hypothetical protein
VIITAMCEPHSVLGCEDCGTPVVVTDRRGHLDWRRAMERDAARVALPDWVWRADDRVTVAIGHNDGDNPTADGPPSAWAKVTVIRADWSGSASRLYVAGEVDEFWSALMVAGSEPQAPAETRAHRMPPTPAPQSILVEPERGESPFLGESLASPVAPEGRP